MISPEMLRSFSAEITKVATAAGMPTAAKVLLGSGVAGGAGLVGGTALGAIGEQAKDDLISGRDMRKQQEMMRKQQRMQQRMAMRGM